MTYVDMPAENCPKCGAQLKVTSTRNPVRNVVRDHMKCPKCGFEKVVERSPGTNLGDLLGKKVKP